MRELSFEELEDVSGGHTTGEAIGAAGATAGGALAGFAIGGPVGGILGGFLGGVAFAIGSSGEAPDPSTIGTSNNF